MSGMFSGTGSQVLELPVPHIGLWRLPVDAHAILNLSHAGALACLSVDGDQALVAYAHAAEEAAPCARSIDREIEQPMLVSAAATDRPGSTR